MSLLNGNLDVTNGEKLVLNVLQTLTCLLSRNDGSKVPVCSSSVLAFWFHLCITSHTYGTAVLAAEVSFENASLCLPISI